MKLSEMRPCDSCDGAIAPHFWVIDVTQALINARAANETLGLNQFFGGRALGLAELFSPAADDAVTVFGDKDPQLRTRMLICNECFLMKDFSMAMVLEKLNERRKRQEEAEAQPDATGHP